ncbi:MAG TPA: hypothetical protein VGV86_10375 [Acidimicrobiales bacterium]|nr:hypothetical protein [Acidimicrobiales bacterium]
MVSDLDRRGLYDALAQRLGHGPAGTLMELLPPVGWADVARQSDLTALRGEMAELRAELKGEIGELHAELRSQLPRLYAANIASMIGVAGLVLAAAKLA